MVLSRVGVACAVTCLTVMAASSASAQVFGTFNWQMQPYCNRVTLTLTSVTGNFTLDGFDDQCGAANKASAVGVGTFNAAGNVTVNFTIVTAPGGIPVHVSAIVSPANGNGTWTDSVGNSGSFVLAGTSPGLPVRPLPTSGVAPATITATEIAPAAIGASKIADGAVGAAAFGTITQRSITSANIAAGGNGSATANCLAGEQMISGGNDGFFDVFVVASRQSGNGWVVFAHNSSASNRTITVHVYCLAP